MKKLTQYVDRLESVVTGKKSLKPLFTLKNFPVFFGCVESPVSEDLVFDMEWGIDTETGVIQLTKLIPLDILYQAQHVDGCGPTWQQYYADFSDYLVKNNPGSVLEIGGGAGQIAKLTTEKLNTLQWTIVEPNPWFKETERIKTVSAFFDENFNYPVKADTVVFSQVLEHAYKPDAFINSIARFLKPGGRVIFAYPQLKLWLERKWTNALNFEHTMFLTDYFVDYLLVKNGFKIIDKFAYKDHSHFYVAELSHDSVSNPVLENKYTEYKKIFLDFVRYHEDVVKEINTKMLASPDPVYLFGAHIFSEFLFAFGLNSNKIISILDNSPTKNGKRLYGTDLKVASPKILKGKGKVNLILKAGIYNEEIKKDILENINNEVTFW